MQTRTLYVDASGLVQRVAPPALPPPEPGLGSPPPTADRLTGVTGAQLAPQLWKLFPRGRAFGRDGARLSDPDPDRVYWGSRRWHGLAGLIGEAMAAIHASLNRALYGAFPSLCQPDLIDDWEAEHGLPDPCVADVADETARRLAVIDARAPMAGANRLEIMRWLGRFGLDTIIDEPNGFEFGVDGFGETGFAGAGLHHCFTYSGPALQQGWIEFAASGFGEIGFGETRDTALHCLIARGRPAHSFAYFEETAP
jgi:uncharacterized protein YmfQ (DUF2313 family)